MSDFHGWKVVNYFEAVFYGLLILLGWHLVYRAKDHWKAIWQPLLSVNLLILAKCAGGICGAVLIQDSAYSNISLIIAYYCLNLISVGILLRLCATQISLVGKYHLEGSDEKTSYNRDAIREKLIFAFILAGVALFIASSNLSSGSNTATAKSLMKLASILYLAAAVLMAFHLALRLRRPGSGHRDRTGPITIMQLVMLVFLFVRIIYTICSLFSGSSTSTAYNSTSKFTLLTGSWQIYVGMAFVEECVATILLIVTLHLVISRVFTK